MTIALINPNTTSATTDAMVEIAQQVFPTASITGLTAPYGVPLITDEAELGIAAEAVQSIDLTGIEDLEGIIIAAFGDPGLEGLARTARVPVVGIAQAGMMSAAEDGRRFSIVTTTPDLVAAIKRRAEVYEVHEQLASVRLTEGDLAETMSSHALLVSRLQKAIDAAVSEDGAEAIVIGGGPLAVAARALAGRVSIPLIEPVPEAARRLAEIRSRKTTDR